MKFSGQVIYIEEIAYSMFRAMKIMYLLWFPSTAPDKEIDSRFTPISALEMQNLSVPGKRKELLEYIREKTTFKQIRYHMTCT